jgi:SAM-dependent methyltransferase
MAADLLQETFDPDWKPTGESLKSYKERLASGFFRRFMSGRLVLDIGYRGYEPESRPVLRHAIGIDTGYPGYDGIRLPFDDGTVDTVYSSHLLEHIAEPCESIREWYRVVRVGGYIVTIVPHQYLYEKKLAPPSRFNRDHKRFYTPGRLMVEFEDALSPNSFRVRHLADNDRGHDYRIPAESHSNWCYEIELVIEKIASVPWELV